jgi:hypothetical protein
VCPILFPILRLDNDLKKKKKKNWNGLIHTIFIACFVAVIAIRKKLRAISLYYFSVTVKEYSNLFSSHDLCGGKTQSTTTCKVRYGLQKK